MSPDRVAICAVAKTRRLLLRSRADNDLLVCSSADLIIDFLEIVEEDYGSVEGCVKCLFEFADEDVAAIKRNLMGLGGNNVAVQGNKDMLIAD